MAASASTIVSFQSESVNDFTSQGIEAIILTTSPFVPTPCSPTMTLSAESQFWNGFGSLFFHAFQSAVSLADSFLSKAALLIRGFGFGDAEGDGAGCGCAKQKDAKAIVSNAARGKCLFIEFSSGRNLS